MLADLAAQKSTKGMIIDVLGRDFPLSAKQIYNKIKKAGITKTYHGMYDCMQELVKNGVLVKENRSYYLNSKWVETTCVTMERIMIQQTVGPVIENSEKEDIRTVTFNSYTEYVKFVRSYMKYFIETVDSRNKNIICWLTSHATRGILNTEHNAELARSMKAKNIDFFIGVWGSTTLDKIVKIIYESSGLKNMKISVPNKFGMRIAIYNDVAICSMLPPETEKEIDRIYKNSNSIEGDTFKIPEYVAKVSNYLSSLDTSIKVIIIRNPVLVSAYKNYILSLFKEDK